MAVMERKIKVDLDFVEPNKSFIHPLFTNNGRIVLPERVQLTEEKLKKIKRIYGNIVYYIDNVPEKQVTGSGSATQRVFQSAKEKSKDIIGEIAKTNKISRTTLMKAERVVEEIISDLNYTELKALNLLKEMQSYDEYIYQHLVNVGILAALFAQKIGTFSSEETKFITLGAYLIDIGLMKIDQQLLKKEGAYTITDIQQIKRHPQLGYELLKDFKDIHPLVLQTVLLHHERFNNRGYYCLPYENLPVAPKIASICDIYDACTTRRPYREAYSSDQTLRVMLNSINRSFEHKLITEFIGFLWPLINQGSQIYKKDDFCILSSNEIAVVREVTSQDILKPRVSVFCRYKIINKNTEFSFYKRPVEVDLKNEAERVLTKIITEKRHIDYLRQKMAEHRITIQD